MQQKSQLLYIYIFESEGKFFEYKNERKKIDKNFH